MADLEVEPSVLQGNLIVPSSKSHTLRAILFGALAKGTTKVERFLLSPDTFAMIEAVRALGAEVRVEGDTLFINGFGGVPKPAEDVIDCGNSGLVLRFIGAIAGLIPQYCILTGDLSIRTNRPVVPLLGALNQLGVFAESSRGDGYAPILIKGPFIKERATLDGEDSQPVSALLIAGAFAPHPIEIFVKNPGEKPWIDLTLNWLERLGIRYKAEDYTHYKVEGRSQIHGFTYSVPGDFSTAAFPIVAALITNSELCIHNIDMDDIQGDKELIPILKKMGAKFVIDKESKTIRVEKGASLKGIQLDINDAIDALPILAVIGSFASGKTEIMNGAIARKKESDRISAIACELKKMGAQIEETPDGLTIYSSNLHGAVLSSHNDHRIALSLSIAAMGAKGKSQICDIECIEKTYPNFVIDFQRIGAKCRT